MSTTTTTLAPANGVIYLKPRPYAAHAGSFMLLPLLPKPKPHKALPSEIWTEIFKFVLEAQGGDEQIWCVARVSQGFRVCDFPFLSAM